MLTQSWSPRTLVSTGSAHHRVGLRRPKVAPGSIRSRPLWRRVRHRHGRDAGRRGGRGNRLDGRGPRGRCIRAGPPLRRGCHALVLSPTWPSHAHHVAVEFVHPVIVGKRALPATAWWAGPDLVAALRLACRAGGRRGGDRPLRRRRRRRPPCDGHRRGALTRCGSASDRRPAPGAADHVLWLDTVRGGAVYGGGFVLAYHLLWELTQVCFEHPGCSWSGPAGARDRVRHLLRRGPAGRGRGRGARAHARCAPPAGSRRST